MAEPAPVALLNTPSATELNRLPMASPLNATFGRSTRSLDGEWDFLLVDRPAAAPEGWNDKETSVPDWRPITVPGVWTRQGTGDLPQYTNMVMPWDAEPPHVPETNPTGLYRTTFDRPEGERVTVTFGGAESMLVLWCNGRLVGMGKDSRLSSSFDLTPYLNDGPNVAAAMVTRWCDGTWLEDQDHWYHAGLNRSVTLTASSDTRIEDLVAQMPQVFAVQNATVANGVEAVKLGATDVLEKPVDIESLTDHIREARATKMIVLEKQTEERILEIINQKGW